MALVASSWPVGLESGGGTKVMKVISRRQKKKIWWWGWGGASATRTIIAVEFTEESCRSSGGPAGMSSSVVTVTEAEAS